MRRSLVPRDTDTEKELVFSRATLTLTGKFNFSYYFFEVQTDYVIGT